MKRIVVTVLMLLLGMLMLWGGTYTHDGGGVSIWFPDHWKISKDGDVLEAEAPDEDAWAQLIVLYDARSVEEGVNAYVAEVKKNIRHFKIIEEGEEIKMNGLTFYFVEGEGVINGVDVESGAAVIVSRKAIVLMTTLNVESSRRKYKRDFKRIVESIRAI
jgi:hypothetical protein